MRCSVQNCSNDTKTTTKSHGITFHMFPKEANLRTAWMEALGISDWEPKDRSTICSEHFRNEDFYETRCGLRKIKSGAVPVVAQDIADDLDAPAAFRVCRICLATDSKMYDISVHKLEKAYMEVSGMTLNSEDKLPRRLCWECTARLLACASFRGKVMRAHELLTSLPHANQYITIRDVRSINRRQNQLRSQLIYTHHTPNEYDLQINENGVVIKSEKEDDKPPILQVELKDEKITEGLYFEEFNENMDNFDDFPNDDNDGNEQLNENDLKSDQVNGNDSDDKLLSEVYVKKKKMKKKVKVKKKEKVIRKKEEGESPMTTMDKYKVSDVKRRRTMDALDESLFTITTLNYEEQIAEIQKRQESTNYKSAPYKCSVCYRGFLVRDRYDAHVIRHNEQSGAYECFICKSRLKTARALRKHLTAQHTEKFSCKGCPFATRNRGVAREHEKWHAGTKYQCPHCPSEFDKLTTYMGHIRIKHVSDFVCELCGYTFVSKKGVDVHKKKKHRLANNSVTLEGPYCETCDVRFASEEAHARHLKLSSRHSSDSDPNRIRNDSQSMNTDKNGRVMRKVERRPVVHPRGEGDGEFEHGGPVTCEQCGVQLRDLRLYAQHFRRLHPDKNRTKYPAMKTPCMCEQCGRIFQSMALLKDHMWVHTGEKRFKCDRCDKSFTQKTNLVFHMRVHSATRPSYECPLCGKHFAFFNNRRRHMFIHTGLKPFKCDTCGKSFTTSGEQRAHVEHVHLKKPWPRRTRTREQEPQPWQKCLDPMED